MWKGLRNRRRQHRLQEVSAGRRPFYTHPRADHGPAPRALAAMLPILQASPHTGRIWAYPARPRRAAPRVCLEIGPRRLTVQKAACPLSTLQPSASLEPADTPGEFLLREPGAIPLARDLDQFIRTLGNLEADYRFECRWGEASPPSDIPETTPPVSPAALAAEAQQTFGVRLPAAYVQHLDVWETAPPAHHDRATLFLLPTATLIKDNHGIRNIPAHEILWQPTWWAVAQNQWGDVFFIDTQDPNPAVYRLDHGLVLESDYNPIEMPAYPSLDALAQAARESIEEPR